MQTIMTLRELVKALQPVRMDGSLDRQVTGIVYDSRRVTPGMVFVAVPGQNTDGHQFIPEAISRGAVAVVSERNGYPTTRVTRILVPDAREALARLAAAFYGHPSARLQVIGVTGTNGKTTVAFMVKAILEAAGCPSGLMGTVRYEIGERVIPASRTTPEAVEIQSMLAQMLRSGCRACVMEVSSHALDQKRVLGVDFDAAVFTNLTQDHLDWHGTMENYYAAKEKLFLAHGGQKKQAAVINIDDAYGERLRQRSDCAVKLTYGLSEAAQLRAVEVTLAANGCRFRVEGAPEPFTLRLPLIGRHNVYNALAAAGAALALHLPLAAIRQALESMPPVPGRLERVDAGQPFTVLVDYAHTDDALRNVLRTLKEITPGRLLLAFGCGGSRDKGKRPKMGRVAAELADLTFITSDNPRKESPDEIAAAIVAGYREVRDTGFTVELDRRRAIEEILRQAQPGDTVLLAGKGHETYQEFRDTVVPFDDRVHAREVLEALGHRPDTPRNPQSTRTP
ncbi:UDP-N-acetylmuramoyl-L-alanyl-D-glutamate--2,6-diaminopimelate ligase [Fontisphaera persica]|uniref:UDP-N-acetylmuramoyl-L-alanyl-D-glutamate--2, 6-diaminopimelate ligase n=1 Tax=Fontisphaera persica TaxID=2974023 RepID=UPI0024BF2386|nr:UDP-N-acetylmuramoyl-L-alanyl-D-glutamate--2,6-diaminopimelate ligase [Fontisphaera persica]WCJ58017.1 UDP-N-acetylmuramoyl-L-alanyl-D-glutamate--2,6-diaminopimelate ligase [Fontisphaera persica]